MKVIIVGAGGTTRDLLRRLGPRWDVVIVDPDPERLALAGQVRDVVAISGDGSSRVVLDRLPLDGADAVVAAANDDDVNLEVCRLAADAGIARIVATAAAPERLGDYREIDVPAYAPSRLTAQRLELAVGADRVGSAEFAGGKAAAIELRIATDAPVAGKTLAELGSERWLVAAVLRDGALIVPHGDTRLAAGDLVTVIGSAADYSLIVRAFATSFSRFPASHGGHVAVAVRDRTDLTGPLPAAAALVRNSSANALLVVHHDPQAVRDAERSRELEELVDAAAEAAGGVAVRFRPVAEAPWRALRSVCAEESVGVAVLPTPGGGRLRRRLAIARTIRSALSFGVPVLFAREPARFERIVVPARARAARRAAIDLAVSSGATVVAVAAFAQAGVGGARDVALGDVAVLRGEAAALGVPVERRVRRGLQSRLLEEEAVAGSLVVLPMPRRAPSPVSLGLAGGLLESSTASLLLLPDAGRVGA